MNLARHNAIPHRVLTENFRNDHSVLNNNFSLVGSPTINNGVSGFSASDYLTLDNVLLPLSGTIIVRASWPGTGTNPRLINSATGNKNRLYVNSTFTKWWFEFSIGGVQRDTYTTNITSLIGQTIDVAFTWEYNGATTTVKSYIDGVLTGTFGPLAGYVLPYDGALQVGQGSSVPFPGTLYGLDLFDITLEADDLLAIHNETLFSDLKVENTLFWLPCEQTYDNGSGTRVTPALGTSGVSEVTLGDGSTSGTFPTLNTGRSFQFNASQYIRIPDNDAFSFSNSDPFSVGGTIRPDLSAPTTSVIIGKWSSLAIGGGEWLLYRNLGDQSLRALFLDNVTGSYLLLYAGLTMITGNHYTAGMTYDGSGTFSASSVQFYVNGEAVSKLSAGTSPTLYNSSAPLVIGNAPGYAVGNNRVGLSFVSDKAYSPLQFKILHRLMESWRHV